MPPPIDPTLTTSASSGADAATMAKLQQLLKDPIAGPKLMAIINQPNTGVGPLGNIASAVGKQSSLSGQAGAGIGGGIAAGIQQLLKKPVPTNRMSGSDVPQGNSSVDVPDPLDAMTSINARHGGAIETRKPRKKKPEKKRSGGVAKAREERETPSPYAKGGRVQSPRGAGCAERGNQFRGIY